MAEIQKPAAKTTNFNLLNFINTNTQAVLFFLLGFICFVIFKDFIFFKKVYLFKDIGSDTLTLYLPLLDGLSDYMKTESVPGWSFSQGMGQNIFPMWLGDFFSVFLTYFDKSKIPYGLAYMEIVKIILSGFFFYRFLKEIKLQNYVCLVFALLYAFTGFMMMGGTWIIYSIEALYVAIILYGFERWLNHKKYFWFVVGIALLTFLQPSYLYPYSFFFASYIFARYFDVKEAGTKDFLIFLSKTIGLAILGVAVSAYQLLPDILQIIESPRVGGESGMFNTLKNHSKVALADEGLRFTTVFRSFGTDMLGNGNSYRGWQNYLEAPIFYCGILCLVIFPQFFIGLTKSQKRVYGTITFLFCLPIFFPYFRFLFWAFSGDYYRTFSLVIVLFLLIYSARALNHIIEKQKINVILLGVTVLFLLFLLFFPNAQWKTWVNSGLRNIVALLIIAYGFFIYRLSMPKVLKNNLKTIFLFVCALEMLYTGYYAINDRQALRDAELKEKVGYNDYTIDAANYVKQIDKSFYRVNKDYQSSPSQHMSLNEGKVQGYYGTASYHSFNQKNYIKFLGAFDIVKTNEEMATRWAKGLVDRPILFSLGCGKYWFSKRTDNAVTGFGFDSIAKFGDVKVLRNRYFVPFGVAYDKIINEEEFKKVSPVQKDFCALRACVISEENKSDFAAFKQFNMVDTNVILSYDNLGLFVNNLKKDSLTITKFSQNNIVGNITVNEPKILFFQFPYDEGWHAKLNNADAKLFIVNAGLTGLILNKGTNNVELSFEPRLKNKGALISMLSLCGLAGLIGFSRFGKKKEEDKEE